MSTGTRSGWEGLWQWISSLREALVMLADLLGAFGRAPEASESLEGVVGKALQPVAPSDGFRTQLRQNLSRAAASHGGVSVEDDRPYRQVLLVSLTALAVGAGIATAVAISHARLARSDR